MMKPLAIYLRNHEAAARGGLDHFRRIGRTHRARPWAEELTDLREEVRQDLEALRRLMRELRIRPDPLAGAAMQLAEKIGRTKLNGRLLSRSPLSDLIEIEGAQDAVHAKGAGWRALISAGLHPTSIDLEDLLRRADSQRDRLLEVHAEVARRAILIRDR